MNKRPELRVFFFGDSICFGQGLSPHKGWVTRIAAGLDELGAKAGVDVLVQNPSINGDTTRQALQRMAYDVQAHEPDILVVQFGMNDCNYWVSDRGCPRVSAKAFAANLEEIIDRGRRFGARRILLLTNHPSGRHTPFPEMRLTYEDSNREYNRIIRSVATECKDSVVLVDVEQHFKLHLTATKGEIGAWLLPDLLHLGPKGHDLYFEVVWPLMREIVAAELAASGTSAQRATRQALP